MNKSRGKTINTVGPGTLIQVGKSITVDEHILKKFKILMSQVNEMRTGIEQGAKKSNALAEEKKQLDISINNAIQQANNIHSRALGLLDSQLLVNDITNDLSEWDFNDDTGMLSLKKDTGDKSEK